MLLIFVVTKGKGQFKLKYIIFWVIRCLYTSFGGNKTLDGIGFKFVFKISLTFLRAKSKRESTFSTAVLKYRMVHLPVGRNFLENFGESDRNKLFRIYQHFCYNFLYSV